MGIKKTWLRRLKQSSQVFFRLLLRGIASATSTAIHHGFHLLGIQAVGSVQRADGVLQLLERDQRGDADFGRGDHQHIHALVAQRVALSRGSGAVRRAGRR